MTDLETARLRAESSIFSLCCRYALAVDQRDYEALDAIFVEDAQLFHGNLAGSSVSGRSEIVAYMRNFLATSSPTFHAVHNVLVDFDALEPGRASGIVTTHSDTLVDGSTQSEPVRYFDRYRQVDGNWLIERRQIEFPFREQPLPKSQG